MGFLSHAQRDRERGKLERNSLWWVTRLCQLHPTCTVHKSENISWSENLDLQLWWLFLDKFWEVTSRDLKTQNPRADKPSVCAQGKRSEFNLYTLQKKEEGAVGRSVKYVWWPRWQRLKVKERIIYPMSSFCLDHLLKFPEPQSSWCHNDLWKETKFLSQKDHGFGVWLIIVNIGRHFLHVY